MPTPNTASALPRPLPACRLISRLVGGVVAAGLLFPPGWLHETFNVADGCTAALTHSLATPSPWATFGRTNRVRCVGDLGNCWDEIKGAAPAKHDHRLHEARRQPGREGDW